MKSHSMSISKITITVKLNILFLGLVPGYLMVTLWFTLTLKGQMFQISYFNVKFSTLCFANNEIILNLIKLCIFKGPRWFFQGQTKITT